MFDYAHATAVAEDDSVPGGWDAGAPVVLDSPEDLAKFREISDAWARESAAALRKLAARPLAERTPGPELAVLAVEKLSDPKLAAPALLDCIEALDRSIAVLQGHKADAIGRFADVESRSTGTGMKDPMKSIKAQLEFLLKLGPTATETLVGRSIALQQLPKTLDALKAGEISESTAHGLADETALLEPDQKQAIEDKVVPDAATQTTAGAKRAAQKAMAELDPELLRERHAEERRRRSVSLRSGRFGMSTLSAYLSADVAAAIYGVIRAHAKTLPAIDPVLGDLDFDERKADALAELILNPADRPKPQVSVQLRVVVPVGSLLGLGDDAGFLAGYGPIPPDLARHVAANATWRRLLTDPADGTVLDYGTTRYRPTTALFERVRSRQTECDAPECMVPSQDCDLDHEVPFRADGTGGSTSEDNLRPRCQHHHDVKGLPGWQVHRNRDGSSTWTTPHGKTYVSRPSSTFPKRR